MELLGGWSLTGGGGYLGEVPLLFTLCFLKTQCDQLPPAPEAVPSPPRLTVSPQPVSQVTPPSLKLPLVRCLPTAMRKAMNTNLIWELSRLKILLAEKFSGCVRVRPWCPQHLSGDWLKSESLRTLPFPLPGVPFPSAPSQLLTSVISNVSYPGKP